MSEIIFWFFLFLFFITLYKNNFSKYYIVFDDILFFSIGFMYYWIIPYYYFFINTNIGELFIPITKYAYGIDEKKKIIFLIFCYSIFFLYVFISNCVKDRIKLKPVKFDRSIILYDIYTLPFVCLSLWYLYRLRSSFMMGYSIDYEIHERGPLTLLSLIILSIALIKTNETKSFKNWQMALYWFMALFVLTLGSRLQFVSSLITVLAMYYTNKKKLRRINILFVAFLGILIFSSIGLLRQGNNININGIIFVFFAEPFFTSYSLFSFLQMNDLPWINIPYSLMVDFINLMPTMLLPNKAELIKAAYISKYEFVSPLGAKNVFVSLMENFGILGSLLFISILAFFIGVLYKKLKCSYYIVIGVLCFSFFRNPFSNSIVKELVEISLFIPIFCYCANKFIKSSVMGSKNKGFILIWGNYLPTKAPRSENGTLYLGDNKATKC